MVTKEERKLKLVAALKAQEELNKKKKIKSERKIERQIKRSERPLSKGDKDYKWCVYDTTPEIEAIFDNGKVVEEYSNGKRVKKVL